MFYNVGIVGLQVTSSGILCPVLLCRVVFSTKFSVSAPRWWLHNPDHNWSSCLGISASLEEVLVVSQLQGQLLRTCTSKSVPQILMGWMVPPVEDGGASLGTSIGTWGTSQTRDCLHGWTHPDCPWPWTVSGQGHCGKALRSCKCTFSCFQKHEEQDSAPSVSGLMIVACVAFMLFAYKKWPPGNHVPNVLLCDSRWDERVRSAILIHMVVWVGELGLGFTNPDVSPCRPETIKPNQVQGVSRAYAMFWATFSKTALPALCHVAFQTCLDINKI